MTKQSIATVFGGSGFVGRYVVGRLADAGYTVRVACRYPDAAKHLKTCGDVGQIVFQAVNIRNEVSVQQAVEHSDVVINLVGILYQKGRQRFAAIQSQGAERIAKAAQKTGATHFVQISALGVDRATASQYARTKMTGEKAVRAAFPEASILRPSIIFGPEDDFFNRFGQMAMLSPVLPLIGGGKTRFQPVYAADVAEAVMRVIAQPELAGHTYELGGPAEYTFEELLRYILDVTGQHASLLPLPFPLASLMAVFMELMPAPPLTRDQVRLLKSDNVASGNLPGFEVLGITPTALESVVPDYLWRYRKGGRFAMKRS